MVAPGQQQDESDTDSTHSDDLPSRGFGNAFRSDCVPSVEDEAATSCKTTSRLLTQAVSLATVPLENGQAIDTVDYEPEEYLVRNDEDAGENFVMSDPKLMNVGGAVLEEKDSKAVPPFGRDQSPKSEEQLGSTLGVTEENPNPSRLSHGESNRTNVLGSEEEKAVIPPLPMPTPTLSGEVDSAKIQELNERLGESGKNENDSAESLTERPEPGPCATLQNPHSCITRQPRRLDQGFYPSGFHKPDVRFVLCILMICLFRGWRTSIVHLRQPPTMSKPMAPVITGSPSLAPRVQLKSSGEADSLIRAAKQKLGQGDVWSASVLACRADLALQGIRMRGITPFDVSMARAYADLSEIVGAILGQAGSGGVVLA